MEWVFDDGGRGAAGYTGPARDCATRAIAIAAELPYKEAYDLVNAIAHYEVPSKTRRGKSSARNGVHGVTMRHIMRELGWNWTPTMGIGTGCTVHLNPDELPPGRIVVSLSKHYAAVIDGVLHDNHDCSRAETRCVYGYWSK